MIRMGFFLGMDASQGSAGEVVNPNPPTNITYADSDKTVTLQSLITLLLLSFR